MDESEFSVAYEHAGPNDCQHTSHTHYDLSHFYPPEMQYNHPIEDSRPQSKNRTDDGQHHQHQRHQQQHSIHQHQQQQQQQQRQQHDLTLLPAAYPLYAYPSHTDTQAYSTQWTTAPSMYSPAGLVHLHSQNQYAHAQNYSYNHFQPGELGYMAIYQQQEMTYAPYQNETPSVGVPTSNNGMSSNPQQAQIHSSPLHGMHQAFHTMPISGPESVNRSLANGYGTSTSPTSEVDWGFLESAQAPSSFGPYNVSPSMATHSYETVAVSNPALTLQINSDSASSPADAAPSTASFDSFDHVQFQMDDVSVADDLHATQQSLPPLPSLSLPVLPSSPGSSNASTSSARPSIEPSPPAPSRVKAPKQLPSYRRAHSHSSSHSSTSSFNYQSGSGCCRPKKESTIKSNKRKATPPHQTSRVAKPNKPTGKRVGRRKGPLTVEQREHACVIRKIRACLRCKYLKKPCDAGHVCKGCQASHMRLWQLPCTRLGVEDLGFFLQDWNLDYVRHVDYAFSKDNFIFTTQVECRSLWISHDYGYCFPVQVREVIFKDNRYSLVNWSEQDGKDKREDYSVTTANLAPTEHGIDSSLLDDYIDSHVTKKFRVFVDKHIQGTPFVSELLMTASEFYNRTGSELVKTALKLVVAYHLTQTVLLIPNEEKESTLKEGEVKWPKSRFSHRNMAPILVKEAVAAEFAKKWRGYHAMVLKGLDRLFYRVYNGDKVKNWPTIFLVSSILLSVWECMEFDTEYKNEAEEAWNQKFRETLEDLPVRVITGLFAAISNRLVPHNDWASEKGQNLLLHDASSVAAMQSIGAHVEKHDDYLRDRVNAKYSSKDFDSLCNKFTSQLLIKEKEKC